MSKLQEEILGNYISVSSGEGLPESRMKPGGYFVYGGNGISGMHNTFLFERQQLIIGRVGAHCGNVYITKENSWITDNALIVSFKEPEKEIIFWYYFLQNLKLREKAFQNAQPVITGGIINRIKISIPSFPEQQRIAKILSTADAVIEKTQVAIAKYKAMKQGMLQDLFTRGIDTTTNQLRPRYEDAPHLYKESKLGMIPKEWEVDTLENLTDKIGSGVTPTGGSEVYKTSGVLFIRSQNVLIGSLSIEDAAFITKEIDEQMEGSRVKPFDVLLNITGASIGRCAYFPEDLQLANVNQHVCIIRFKQNSKPRAVFAAEYFNSDFIQRQIYKAMAVGNREGLNFQQTKAFIYPVIDTEELDNISPILENLNRTLQTEQTYLQKIQLLKKGLMEDLLTGKKLVKVEEELTTQNEN